jgi:hypothetical protein
MPVSSGEPSSGTNPMRKKTTACVLRLKEAMMNSKDVVERMFPAGIAPASLVGPDTSASVFC